MEARCAAVLLAARPGRRHQVRAEVAPPTLRCRSRPRHPAARLRSALGLPLHPAHLPSAGAGRAFREVNAGLGTGAAGAVGAVGGPSATSVHELLECPVCTCSMFPPIHQVGVSLPLLRFQMGFQMGLRADLGISVMGYAKLMASNASTLNNQISSQACKNFFIMYPSPIWISSKPRIHGIWLTTAGMFSYQLVHVSSTEAGSGEVSSLREWVSSFRTSALELTEVNSSALASTVPNFQKSVVIKKRTFRRA
ncbi:uncharacterized protein LOC101782781 isoform X1 [Setaria italica]|uniref:uncharacterized protein LOC101782781 isoform X1 n=2 Tax=Setaria italica TaxID=4555 RepID=UPI000BE60532|nr:uncharacterized protein LOC101782781 isoform X1 [Setaria italica]